MTMGIFERLGRKSARAFCVWFGLVLMVACALDARAQVPPAMMFCGGPGSCPYNERLATCLMGGADCQMTYSPPPEHGFAFSMFSPDGREITGFYDNNLKWLGSPAQGATATPAAKFQVFAYFKPVNCKAGREFTYYGNQWCRAEKNSIDNKNYSAVEFIDVKYRVVPINQPEGSRLLTEKTSTVRIGVAGVNPTPTPLPP